MYILHAPKHKSRGLVHFLHKYYLLLRPRKNAQKAHLYSLKTTILANKTLGMKRCQSAIFQPIDFQPCSFYHSIYTMPRGEFSVGRLLATPASYAYQKILFKYLKKR
jgi:hypothetical protein